MELIRGLHNILPRHRHCVLTIGNFDGVHLGHQSVLQRVKARAQEAGLPAAVMIFEPQPLELFRPDLAPARLTRWREKFEAIRELGLDRMICTRFDQQFADMSASHFIEEMLVNRLGVDHLIVGDDFHFGHNREGDYNTLKQAGETFGFSVSDSASYRQDTYGTGSIRVSSTLIREALSQGDFAHAGQMLGRPYTISGRVIHGAKTGRQLGFATANIPLRRIKSPLKGVFAVTTQIQGRLYHGMANIGRKPTVGSTEELLEMHIFDFQGDLYGKHLQVRPHKHLRDEKKFSSLDELKAQIQRDANAARNFFENE